MKKYLLIVICVVLFTAVTSASLLIYIDLFKPSVRGAQKAYKNEEYDKAASIFEKVLQNNNDDIEAVIGLSKTYYHLSRSEESENLLLSCYANHLNSPKLVKRISEYYINNDLIQEYKAFLTELNSRKSEKWVKRNTKSMKPVMLERSSEEYISVSNFIFQCANAFRDQEVSIDTEKQKKIQYENVIKSAMLFKNYGFDPDPTSKEVFDMYGTTFNTNINSNTYRAAYVDGLAEKILNLYDYKDFTIDPEINLYRIIDTSGFPDIFKFNQFVFSKYSLDDRSVVFYPVLSVLTDKMNGFYKLSGKIFYFDTTLYGGETIAYPSSTSVPEQATVPSSTSNPDIKANKRVMNSYIKWRKGMTDDYSSIMNCEFYRKSNYVCDFYALVRQVKANENEYRIKRYKTIRQPTK